MLSRLAAAALCVVLLVETAKDCTVLDGTASGGTAIHCTVVNGTAMANDATIRTPNASGATVTAVVMNAVHNGMDMVRVVACTADVEAVPLVARITGTAMLS